MKSVKVIADWDKAQKYAPILSETYDSLYEIDLTNGISTPIFFDERAYYTDTIENIFDKDKIRSFCNKYISEIDRKDFLDMFCEQSLKSISKIKEVRRLEYRIDSDDDKKVVIRLCLIPYKDDKKDIILCYCYNSTKEKNDENLIEINDNFSNLFRSLYKSVYIVELKTGMAKIFRSSEFPYAEGESFKWSSLLKHYKRELFYDDDLQIIDKYFSLEGLIKLNQLNKDSYNTYVRYKSNDITYSWVQLSVMICKANECIKAYITVKDSHEEHLIKSIVDKFVFNNCDYFIYLDAINNSYIMFSYNESGTPLPPVQSLNYEEDYRKQVNNYVVDEDREDVIEKLMLSNIYARLDESEQYSFSFGIRTALGDYERKLIKFVYYDKPNKMILLTRTDITDIYFEKKNHKEKLQQAIELAKSDPLTKIYNRTAMWELVNESLIENGEKISAIMFLDLDNFKAVNDNLGHTQGDMVLQDVAHSLKKSVRQNDIVGRIGGDEFVVYLSNISNKDEALKCAERISRNFEDINHDGLHQLGFSCSIGISFAPDNGNDFESLVKKADMALYKSKHLGKNRCSIYSK